LQKKYSWVKFVGVELGCGKNVPSLRDEGLFFLKEIMNSKIIRVNPEIPLPTISQPELRAKYVPVLETAEKFVADVVEKMKVM